MTNSFITMKNYCNGLKCLLNFGLVLSTTRRVYYLSWGREPNVGWTFRRETPLKAKEPC